MLIGKSSLRRFLIICLNCALFSACGDQSSNSKHFKDFPSKVLWAWERPENLEFLDAKNYGVAFLAQTLILEDESVKFRPRRQILKVAPETKLIAVTRIESQKVSGKAAAMSDEQRAQIVQLILKTLEFKGVSAIQIDFDAIVSEREFYRRILIDLRQKMPANMALSMTALASFCVGDRWLENLPIDEAVPMLFRMGADNEKIKNYLASGNDFATPLCRTSYGIATDEPIAAKLDSARRLYVFKAQAQPWTPADVETIEQLNR